jgi:hypothetical protein
MGARAPGFASSVPQEQMGGPRLWFLRMVGNERISPSQF